MIKQQPQILKLKHSKEEVSEVGNKIAVFYINIGGSIVTSPGFKFLLYRLFAVCLGSRSLTSLPEFLLTSGKNKTTNYIVVIRMA